jgi:hypothetical protein
MAFKKKAKSTNGVTDGGFDATPPKDGRLDIAADGKKGSLYEHKAINQSKKGLKKALDAYKAFLITSFRSSSRNDQENWIHRFAQILCVGISAIVLNSFYSVLLPPIRIISLPLLVAVAWFVANKMVAPAIIKRLGNNMSDF